MITKYKDWFLIQENSIANMVEVCVEAIKEYNARLAKYIIDYFVINNLDVGYHLRRPFTIAVDEALIEVVEYFIDQKLYEQHWNNSTYNSHYLASIIKNDNYKILDYLIIKGKMDITPEAIDNIYLPKKYDAKRQKLYDYLINLDSRYIVFIYPYLSDKLKIKYEDLYEPMKTNIEYNLTEKSKK